MKVKKYRFVSADMFVVFFLMITFVGGRVGVWVFNNCKNCYYFRITRKGLNSIVLGLSSIDLIPE